MSSSLTSGSSCATPTNPGAEPCERGRQATTKGSDPLEGAGDDAPHTFMGRGGAIVSTVNGSGT